MHWNGTDDTHWMDRCSGRNMPLIINTEKLKGELNEHLSTKKRALADVRLTKRVLSEACPLIEKKLGDPNYLRNFSHMGKQAFYDDEPFGDKETRGLFATGQRVGDHMVNQFKVVPHVAAGGYGSFEIINNKSIYSKKWGRINLFDWLWNGFGPYTSTVVKVYERLSQTEIWQRSWAQRRSWRRGTTFYATKPMTFYYRYGSKFFYNLRSRRGMDPGLVDKFHNYVFGAVEWGMEEAIKNILETEEGNDRMKQVYEELLRYER